MWVVEDKKNDEETNSQLKTLACSISVMAIHLLGDVPSPILLGKLEDSINNWEQSMLYISCVLILSPIIWGITYCVIRRKDKLQSLREPMLVLYNDV